MPRTKTDSSYEDGSCWSKRTRLEKILIVIIIASILIAVIFLIFLLTQLFTESKTVCSSPECLLETSNILQFIDPQTDPCDDFYKFVCGNFLKNAHGDEELALPQALFHKSQRKLMELYWEPIERDENKMVKASKKLFQACMNETEIERDNLGTMIEAITMAGGWPVIEGDNWNQGNFDWIRSSSILRRLGYFYSVFLEVQISVDPNNSSRSILAVSLPTNLWDHSSRDFDAVEFMAEVAVRFGARNKQSALLEMEEAQKFLLQLQLEAHSHPQMSFKKYTVEEYQQIFGPNTIDWLHFINNIVGRTALISKTEQVLFQPPETLKNWLAVIQRTPKRTQANYLMWKVIESTLPYLTQDLRSRKMSYERKPESREEFCLRTAHSSRYVHSPMDIIYDRRYLPLGKRRKIQEMADRIKSEFISKLETKKWLNEDDQNVLKEMSIVIGQSGDYLDDKVLNELNFDMIDTRSDSFLNLYAQANRNYQTAQYQQIHRTTENVLLGVQGNYLPSVATEGFYFNENRPQYLNFGSLGSLIAQYFSGTLIRHSTYHNTRISEQFNGTENNMGKIIKCWLNAEDKNETLPELHVVTNAIQKNMANEIAYDAYEKWTEENGEELQLIGVNFTPKQLFWISTTIGSCQPIKHSSYRTSTYSESSTVVSKIMRNSAEFAEDFKCTIGSPMHPDTKCEHF